MSKNTGFHHAASGLVKAFKVFYNMEQDFMIRKGPVKNMTQENSGVQSAARIFSIIETLAQSPKGLPLQEVAAKTGLAKSTAHRLLASLIQLGYVLQDGMNGHYRLTLKMFELSSGVVSQMDILSIAKPYLDRLAMRCGEAVHLVIRDGVDVLYLYKSEVGGMRMGSRIGLRSPMYCTGVGKAIMATLTPEEVESIWKQSHRKVYTQHTITTYSQLLRQLEKVKRNGWAVDDEENELGIRCLALALPGLEGRAEAAFSISSLAPNMTDERIERLARMSVLTQQEIMRDMGARIK